MQQSVYLQENQFHSSTPQVSQQSKVKGTIDLPSW